MGRFDFRIFSFYLFILLIFTSFTLSLPSEHYVSSYRNKYDKGTYVIGELTNGEQTVQVVVDVVFRYFHETANRDLYVSIQYYGSHFFPAFQQPRINEIEVVVDGIVLQSIEHETSDPYDPHFNSPWINNAVYEYYYFKIAGNRIRYFSENINFQVDLDIQIESIEEDENLNGIFESDFASLRIERDFILFNKENLKSLVALLWLPILYFIPMYLFPNRYTIGFYTKYLSKTSSFTKKKHYLQLVGIWIPNLGVMFCALLIAPLTYIHDKATNNVQLLPNKAFLTPIDTFLDNFLIILGVNIFWYLIIPILVEYRFKWPKGDLQSKLTIHTELLKQLGVKYEASEVGFFKNIQLRAKNRILYGGIVLQLIVQFIMIDFASIASTIFVYLVPFGYLIWVFSRKSVLGDYWIRKSRSYAVNSAHPIGF